MSQGFGPKFDAAQRAYDYLMDDDDEERYTDCRLCGCEFEVMRQDQRICEDCRYKPATEDEE